MRPPLPTPPPRLQPRSTSSTVLPLTTIFTPPPSCLDAPFTLAGSASGVAGFSSAWRDNAQTSSQCYPEAFSLLQGHWYWYSPGVCASGYNVAQTSKPSDSPGLTQAWCCPSGYTIIGWLSNDNNYQACTSLASNTAVISTNGNSTTTVTPSISFVAYQWPMSVEWASSDLALFTPASAPVIASDATSTITSGTGKATHSGVRQTGEVPGASTTPNNDTGLSTGATAGIAVGVVVAVIAILGGIFFWWFKRRRSAQRIPDEPDKGARPFYVDQKVELPVEEPRRKPMTDPIELDGLNLQELDVPERDKDSQSINREPAELAGNRHGNERPG